MNIQQLKQALPVLAKAKKVPLIIGHKGIGKSQVINQVAKSLGIGFFDFRTGICSDAGDIRGLPFKLSDEKGTPISTGFLPPNELPRKGKGIFFIDEINRGNKEVLQALFQLVLDRRVGEYELPDGWIVVAAMNPPTEDYHVNDFDDAAFLDRFCQIKLDPTVDEWVTHAKDTGVNTLMIDWIRENPQFLDPKLTDFIVTATPSRRAVLQFDQIEKLAQEAKLDELIVKEIGFGMIGVEATSHYYEFKKNNSSKVFTAVDILDNYSKIQNKVKEYSDVNSNRGDILGLSNENLAKYMEENVLTKEQEVNFVEYFCTIPKDLAMAFFQTNMLKNQKIRDNLFKVHGEKNPELSIFGDYDGKTHKNPLTAKIMESFKGVEALQVHKLCGTNTTRE